MAKRIYLIGAGPGDPDLLTIKAAKILQIADAVVYDKLISKRILAYIPKKAERYFAGKSKSQHMMKQSEINNLLVELGKRKDLKTVVRLKGGDPFIFGRGGEEIEELTKHKISFEAIPGVTAAAAAAAALGIPLTHRDYVSGVHFFTGHGCHEIEPNVDWKILASEDKTLAIYMGLTNIKTICKRLVENGLSAKTRAAVVENASLKNQRQVFASVGELPKILERKDFQSPSLIIIGKVVSFAEKLRIK